ncbi:hypothetical protein [Pseudogemmobacter sonorensis]|uniref:hypothetical protein n=1 Tax=Pseudogemmobacter sonorensis TaxID=2989681 RepID=UPI0036C7E6EA
MVRGPVSMVIVGIVTLFMFGLVALGPRAFSAILPESVLVYIETMGDAQMMADRGYVPGGGEGRDPMEFLRDTNEGWLVRGPIAALEGGGAAFVTQVLAGHSSSVRGQAPGAIELLTPVAGCDFTPPSEGAHVAHLGIRSARNRDLAISTYDDAALARAVAQYAKAYRERGKAFNRPSASGAAYQAFDVAVTETARPVYLVIDAFYHDSWLVNVHLAPGARVERVILLGGAQMGVANLPAEVPVEVMLRAGLEACGVKPFYPLNPGHAYYAAIVANRLDAERIAQTEAGFLADAAVWEGAFRRWFGIAAAESLAGSWRDLAVAVAGPVPATPEGRAVWRPVAGAPARLTSGQYLETPELAAEGRGFAARVEAVTRAFAWGDLENLNYQRGF